MNNLHIHTQELPKVMEGSVCMTPGSWPPGLWGNQSLLLKIPGLEHSVMAT